MPKLYPYSPTEEELAALRHFAKWEGRYWKAALREMWMKAHYPGYSDISHFLQRLRNNAEFDLTAFRFPA